MKAANYYEQMAENCEREAAALPDIQLKNEFKEVARQWRELAQGVYAVPGVGPELLG
jgi:hypothetical protein